MDDGIGAAGIHDLLDTHPVPHVEDIDLDRHRRIPGPVRRGNYLVSGLAERRQQVGSHKATSPGHEDAHASGAYPDAPRPREGGGSRGSSPPNRGKMTLPRAIFTSPPKGPAF